MNLKVEWFRERSADCAKLAAAARDTEAATMLKDMADEWRHLAEMEEKMAARKVDTTTEPDRASRRRRQEGCRGGPPSTE